MSSERMAVGLLFIAIAVLASTAPAKSDTWWLIRAGQDIWQPKQVAVTDTYSHTIRGRPWPNHEWLTDVLFYGAHRLGGMPGLAALCVALILFALSVSWLLMRGPFELRFMLFIASLISAAGAWAMRPQLVTMACFMVACWLLATRRVWWLPFHFFLWANLHGAVILGLIALGAAGVADTLRERRLPWQLMAVAGLCVIATLATPLGIDLYLLLASYGGGRGEGIEEWMRPELPPSNPIFWATAAALVVGVAMRARRLDAAGARLTAIALVMLPFAVSAMRNIAIFLLIAIPAVSALWAVAAPAASSRPRDSSKVNAAILAAATLGALALIARMWTYPAPQRGWTPLQPGAIAAVAACQPPLYNTYDDGGALIWWVPQQPVFIDSRYDPYPLELFAANEVLERTGVYQPLFDRHQFKCAIAPTGSPIVAALVSDPEWVVTYRDDQRVVMATKAAVK